MFHYQQTIFPQQFLCKNQIRKVQKLRWVKIVGWICKNEVKLFRGPLQIFKNIGFYCADGKIEFRGNFGNVVHTTGKTIHSRNVLDAPGCKFKRNVACARKQVEHFQLVKIKPVVQDVEKAFLGHVRSRSYW